jgi:hypothetical protein
MPDASALGKFGQPGQAMAQNKSAAKEGGALKSFL